MMHIFLQQLNSANISVSAQIRLSSAEHFWRLRFCSSGSQLARPINPNTGSYRPTNRLHDFDD